MPIRAITFDLNGTLTDLSKLDAVFREAFGFSHVRREWFTEALKLAFAITASGRYEPFSNILNAVLQVVEQRYGTDLTAARRKQILLQMRKLPAYPDVRPALERLRELEFQLVVLTNSSEHAAREGLKSAELDSLFDDVISADFARRLKPSPAPYRLAARKLGVPRRDMLLVAAHSWDIAGAMNAGCRAAFVARPGQVLNLLTPKPDFIVSDLLDLARALDK